MYKEQMVRDAVELAKQQGVRFDEASPTFRIPKGKENNDWFSVLIKAHTDQNTMKPIKIEKRFDFLDNLNDVSLANFDDVLDWSQKNEISDATLLNQIRQKINETRQHLFNNKHATSELILEIVKSLVEHNCGLLYNDAKILLFPEKDLSQELSVAVTSKEILARHSIARDIYYFDICSLMKWLIRNNLLPIDVINEFPALEIASAKENLVEYRGSFNSLKKLISLGRDRNFYR